MGTKTRHFFIDLLSSEDPKSSRRFVTLLISGIFIITCTIVLLLVIFLFIRGAKLQGINIQAVGIISSLLKEVIKFEAGITVAGLGFITAPDFAKILIAWFSKKGDSEEEDGGGSDGKDSAVKPDNPDK